MFTAFEIENFRGIERLSVNGLSRVNLIIGKNNTGKTALIEVPHALAVPEHAGGLLGTVRVSSHSELDLGNFEAYWRPLFRSGDAERGFVFRAMRQQADSIQFSMKKARGERVITGGVHNPNTPLRPFAWTLDCEIINGNQSQNIQISGNPNGDVTFPQETDKAFHSWWVSSSAPNLSGLVKEFSQLKQEGKDLQVRDMLHQLDDRIENLEILSPTGMQAELFVRVAGEPRLLPFKSMGDGVQRGLDIAVGLVLEGATQISIDEFENGLHHSILEPLWTWLARISASRKVQVFATTHSEECVQAACRAFSALSDDELRVVRLDRQQHQIATTVYDRQLVEAADSMGVELRG